jgi:hypothetical protein
MRTNHLIGLAVLLVALLVVGRLVHRTPTPEDFRALAEAALPPVAPADLAAGDVVAFELARGAETEPRVRLERTEAGWRVASAWNAPADGEAVADFLETVTTLRGEIRSEAEGASETFGLEEDAALRVRLYTAGEEAPAFELLVGKTLGFEASFVRVQGSDRVYRVNENLRSAVGLWSQDRTAEAKSTHWLETRVYPDLDADAIRRIEIAVPQHTVVYERVPEEVRPAGTAETEATPEAAPDEGVVTADGMEAEAEETPPAWRVVQGGPGGEIRSGAVWSLVQAFADLEVEDVVEPARREGLDLAEPPYPYRAEALLADGSRRVLYGSRDREKHQAFVMRPGEGEPLYGAATWRFEQVFLQAREIFTFEPPRLPNENVLALTVHRGGNPLGVEREDEGATWRPVPETGYPLRIEAVGDWLEAIATWRAGDFAAEAGAVAYGLGAPAARLEVRYADGGTRSLLLGAEHPYQLLYYIAESPDDEVYLGSESVRSRLFPEGETLFDLRRILDVEPGSVLEATATAADGTVYTLTRVPAAELGGGAATDGWTLTHGGETVPADETEVGAWLGSLTRISGAGFYRGADPDGLFPGGGTDRVVLRTEAGETGLELGAEAEGHFAARVSGKPLPIRIIRADRRAAVPEPATFRMAAPTAPESSGAPAPEDDGEAPRDTGAPADDAGDGADASADAPPPPPEATARETAETAEE